MRFSLFYRCNEQILFIKVNYLSLSSKDFFAGLKLAALWLNCTSPYKAFITEPMFFLICAVLLLSSSYILNLPSIV